MRVFVSYTSKDPAVTREQLEKVESRLKPFCSPFIDLLHNEKGKQCRVDRELRRCDVVLQFASPKYQSQWVQKELITARKRNKPVIKVGIDELLAMDDESCCYVWVSVSLVYGCHISMWANCRLVAM